MREVSFNVQKLFRLIQVFYAGRRDSPEARERILRLIIDVYNGVSPDYASSPYLSFRLRAVAHIVFFGKECGIPREDWLVVLGATKAECDKIIKKYSL